MVQEGERMSLRELSTSECRRVNGVERKSPREGPACGRWKDGRYCASEAGAVGK